LISYSPVAPFFQIETLNIKTEKTLINIFLLCLLSR